MHPLLTWLVVAPSEWVLTGSQVEDQCLVSVPLPDVGAGLEEEKIAEQVDDDPLRLPCVDDDPQCQLCMTLEKVDNDPLSLPAGHSARARHQIREWKRHGMGLCCCLTQEVC